MAGNDEHGPSESTTMAKRKGMSSNLMNMKVGLAQRFRLIASLCNAV